MADVRAFIEKWNGRTLQNDGSVVSKEYKSFQTAFINAMKKIAEGLHGEVVNVSKGHCPFPLRFPLLPYRISNDIKKRRYMSS